MWKEGEVGCGRREVKCGRVRWDVEEGEMGSGRRVRWNVGGGR